MMLGNYIRVEKPMEPGDEVIGICFTGSDPEGFVTYNNKYYR